MASITLRVSADEKKAIRTQADTCGLTTSEYVRRRILGYNVTPKTPKIDMEAITILRQISGMIKQIFKQEITDKTITYQVLNEAKNTIKFLRGNS